MSYLINDCQLSHLSGKSVQNPTARALFTFYCCIILPGFNKICRCVFDQFFIFLTFKYIFVFSDCCTEEIRHFKTFCIVKF